MKKEDMERLFVRVDEETKRKWKIYCAKEGTSTQKELERFIHETLEKFDKENPGIL